MQPAGKKYLWHVPKRTHIYPTTKWLRSGNKFKKAYKWIIQGWEPIKPFIDRNTRIIALGSCFAAYVTRFLDSKGYNVYRHTTNKLKNIDIHDSYIVRYNDGFNHTFAILQQFQWALEGKTFKEDLWYDKDLAEAGYSEGIRDITREILLSGNVFIFTLGLSEVWYNIDTDEVFWRGIPVSKYNKNKHKFRLTTVSENYTNLLELISIIHKHIPSAKIIFTLSPVPLKATFRDVSCVTANTVSKSILRVAIDMIMNHNFDYIYYWPSYEIVKEFFVDAYQDDNRHVKNSTIAFIMGSFSKLYVK